MAKCETCGHDYTNEICQRVLKHDNREYDIVSDICKYYKCTDDSVFNRSGKPRELYIFAMCHILGRKQKDIAGILGMRTANVSRDLKRFFIENKGVEYKFLNKY